MEKKNLCGLTAEEIFDIIKRGGFEFRHAVTIANLIYKKRTTDFSLANKLPKSLLAYLAENTFTLISEPVANEISADRTIKYLFRNRDGISYETVFIPETKRNTVCVSTQSGCRMGCPFCMTAKYGFYGDLSAGDILTQVIGIPFADKVTRVVFMGMGEPLDNTENVLKACNILTSERGMAISPGNITVSTVGITPGVKRFLEESACNLTVSLFSPFTDERIRVVPAEKKYPVSEIIDIMKNHPVRKKRRFSIAYVMIKNVNDTNKHLNALIKMLKGTGIRVNLLPYHPVKNDPVSSSSQERMMLFKHNLVMSGVSASIRRSRGTDISAACGLLASGLKPSGVEK
jgi:23S rRNA (adenine2503-C2)-methyltransferase